VLARSQIQEVFPLAACPWLVENSRLGFRLAGNTLHQGFGAGKYLIGIGDTASVVRYAWLESLKAQQQKAEVGYGETSGLLPQRAANAPAPGKGKKENPYAPSTWDKASAEQLQKGRENIMDISERNSTVRKATASSNSIEQEIWGLNVDAASHSDGSLPGKYFFIRQDGVGNQHPSKKAGYGQGTPITSYGPFRNVGGGDVPRGNNTYIDIYDK
jgi:hypothetical protein